MINFIVAATMLLQVFTITIEEWDDGSLVTGLVKYEKVMEDEECSNKAKEMALLGNYGNRTTFAFCRPFGAQLPLQN